MTSKFAVVTGASSGIGECVAFGLAEDGFDVALVARNEKELARVLTQIQQRSKSNRSFIFPLDLSLEDGVEEFAAEVSRRFDHCDLLFNNAGAYESGTLEISLDDFDRLYRTNVRSAFHLTKVLLPSLKRSPRPYIMNLSSICGVVGFEGVGAYTASKFALNGLTQSLFREFAPSGVRCTAICPSWVNTKMSGHSPVAQGDRIQPEEILRTVRYLWDLPPQAAIRELVLECTSDIW